MGLPIAIPQLWLHSALNVLPTNTKLRLKIFARKFGSPYSSVDEVGGDAYSATHHMHVNKRKEQLNQVMKRWLYEWAI